MYSLQSVNSSVNDIKVARYALQLSVCVINKNLLVAHSSSGSALSHFNWLDEISNTLVIVPYWKQILKLQIHTLIYIQSIRGRNFQMHIMALCPLMKWYCALDHYNYLRWLTFHVLDLVNLEQQHPDVYKNFCKEHISFNKSGSEFSTMALDQLNEQSNEIIKGSGVATRLLNSEEESALRRWELCGSEIVDMISSFEESINPTPSIEELKYKKHHENTPAFRQMFVGDVKRLLEIFIVNPFDTNDFTTVNNETIIFDEDLVKSVKDISDLGKK